MLKKNLVLGFMLIMLLAMSTNLMADDQVVTSLLDDGGGGTLREAIADVGPGEEITFSVTGTIYLDTGTYGELSIDEDMTITGPGADELFIDGGADSRIFVIDSDDDEDVVTITGLTITNGSAVGGDGGGIYNYSDNLTLENCTISGNSSNGLGGGMCNCGLSGTCSPTLTNCTISGNSADDEGGGMYNDGMEGGNSSPTLTNCILWNDNASEDGNEVFNSNATPSYSYCDIEDCFNEEEVWDSNLGTNGGSNIDSDPLFVNEPNPASAPQVVADHDLLLSDGSPCLGAGSAPDAPGVPSTDKDGRDRPLPAGASHVDMGAFEQYSDGTLPVVLSVFTAQYLNNIPTLYWETQSETDNIGWNLYRNTEEDFSSSQKITDEMIQGNGTTTEPSYYYYFDNENLTIEETYYYWLESIDYSGISQVYSRIAQITIPDPSVNPPDLEPPIVYDFKNVPNPVNGSAKFQFTLDKSSFVSVSIYNIKGKLVKTLPMIMVTSQKLV